MLKAKQPKNLDQVHHKTQATQHRNRFEGSLVTARSSADINLSLWNVKATNFAKNTVNPIREIVDNLKIDPNPDKSFIPLSIGEYSVSPPADDHRFATIFVIAILILEPKSIEIFSIKSSTQWDSRRLRIHVSLWLKLWRKCGASSWFVLTLRLWIIEETCSALILNHFRIRGESFSTFKTSMRSIGPILRTFGVFGAWMGLVSFCGWPLSRKEFLFLVFVCFLNILLCSIFHAHSVCWKKWIFKFS